MKNLTVNIDWHKLGVDFKGIKDAVVWASLYVWQMQRDIGLSRRINFLESKEELKELL